MREYLPLFGPNQPVSRRHALKVFAATAGGAILGSAQRSHAELPWGEPEWTQTFAEAGNLRLGPARPYQGEIRQDFPTLALSPDRRALWTSWTHGEGPAESILVRRFGLDDESWSEPVTLSTPEAGPTALQSELVVVDERILVVWSQCDGPRWRLLARSLDPASGSPGPLHVLAGEGETEGYNGRPALAAVGDRVLVAWQCKPRGATVFSIRGLFVAPDGRPIEPAPVISGHAERDCCRPALSAAPDGSTIAIAFDQQDAPGTQNVTLALLVLGRNPRVHLHAASRHPASNLAPSVAWSPDSKLVWTAWQSNRHGPDGWDIPRWVELRAFDVEQSTWRRLPSWMPPDPDANRWTMQSLEFPRVVVAPSGAVAVLARPSHAFALQYFSGAVQSPLYRLPADGWGGRGRWLRGVFDDAGRLWVTRRDIGQNVLHAIDGFDASFRTPTLEPDDEQTQSHDLVLEGRTRHFAWPAARGVDRTQAAVPDEGQLLFGDIHGHSWQSDGLNDPEESFLRARDVFRDDFHALTDHDRFVQKRVTDGLWQEQKDLVDHYHADGKFVTFYAQEWTTPRIGGPHGFGHYNVYSADPRLPLFDHGDERFRDLPGLLAALPAYDAFAIPHHIGWTGIRWDVWDDRLIPAIEICSVHGAFEYEGNEPLRHRGGIRGSFVRDGLARGLRFGIVGGSDQHGLIWHHGICWKRNAYRAGLTGVWAKEFSRTSILEAIRNRRTFATTGVKMCLRFSVAGTSMGGAAQSPGAPRVEVDVAVPPEEGRLGWLQVVRNGEIINQVGGEAQRSQFAFVDESCPAGQASWYYLRVVLADNNMAWSSPVWVTRA